MWKFALCRALSIVLLLVAAPRFAIAAWPSDPATNLPLCTASGDQAFQTIASDGAGGAIITWQDFRSGTGYHIYAQHVLATGVVDAAWPLGGLAVCTATNSQFYPVIVPDRTGGAIIAWEDDRAAPDYNIYAQHVLAGGIVDPAWPVNGVVLCASAGNQYVPTLVADGAGGAIVTWFDYRSGTNYDIYAQHVLAGGAVDPAWPVNGRAICTAASSQQSPTIVSDGAGGGIVTWYDFRSGVTLDIYAQHVLANGAVDPAWPANGRAICTAAGNQFTPVIDTDGAGGAIIAWFDFRSGTSYDIYAQHVLASGAVDPAWPLDGLAICTASGDQVSPTLVADGAGGAIITWQDLRGADYDIYAQHVLAGGTVDAAWPADGRPLCAATFNQISPIIVADGAGGAIVTWQDSRNGVDDDIYAQHVTAGGAIAPGWPSDGVAISTATGQQSGPMILPDGGDAAIITWQDARSGENDIYAERVGPFGYLGTPEPEITAVDDVPDDNGGKVQVTWNASYLDLAGNPNLAAYDIYRAAPPAAARAISRGANARPAGASGYAWQYVATTSAFHFVTTYTRVVATFADSTGAGNPRTAFRIVARNAAGTMDWPSLPDSGYSVDNLPPLPPAPFTGEFADGVAILHWDPNVEPDFANYLLYRGTTLDFAPSSANRIAALADTGYVDPAGSTYWYKLTAVDIHGNESGASTLLPAGALAVPGGALPRALALARPSPNPASGPVALRYALPHETRVALAIYDAAGRRVRELVSGTEPAGAHALTWDRRDDAGHVLGAGLYFVRLEAEGRVFSQRFATLN